MNLYKSIGKRVFDLLASISILLISLPFFLIIIPLQVMLYRKIIYTQIRHTKNLRTFRIYKFASMRDVRDKNNAQLPDNLRITKLGRILRRNSLDELPNLFNVIKGEMSIVGPRPLPVNFKNYMPTYMLRRYEVKSGITGLAQVSGRNSLSWRQKIDLDLEYVDKFNFIVDLKIIVLSIRTVINSSSNVNNELNEKGIDNYRPNFD